MVLPNLPAKGGIGKHRVIVAHPHLGWFRKRNERPKLAPPYKGACMELLRAEKVGEFESECTKVCRVCSQELRHVRTVVDANTGNHFHMFECCECGERIWED
jgi:hypothetical protein